MHLRALEGALWRLVTLVNSCEVGSGLCSSASRLWVLSSPSVLSHLAERYEIAGVEGTATSLAIVEKPTMKHLYLFVRWQERKAVIWG